MNTRAHVRLCSSALVGAGFPIGLYMTIGNKLIKLQGILNQMGSVLVAFSGGTDSAFLLKVARDILGDKAMAVTAFSDFLPAAELGHARQFAKKLNARHLIFKFKPTALIWKNPPDRCYYCKRELFSRLLSIARKRRVQYVIDGSNFDDIKDFRPGRKALLELKIRSPLQEAGLTKKEIRVLSRGMGLQAWNKPSFTCLATRIPYGERITAQKIRMIEEAELFIRKLGISQIRLRHHGSIARIEVAEQDIPLLVKNRKKISQKLRRAGFTYIAADLDGYRRGSLIEDVQWKRKK